VDLLQAGLTGREQAEWLASMRLDPPEEDRADIRYAHLAANLLASLTGKVQRVDTFLDALPWRDAPPPPPPVTPASLRNKIDAVMTMLGGKR
jgi:hypothetical protein